MIKVTIGLMVYNEAEYLREAVLSIQAQKFSNYEILVGNNASSDGSTEIIDELAKLDSRIVHLKRAQNVGALQNWNDIVQRASGEYFILAGGHDRWSQDYLGKLVAALDAHSNAVIAFTKTQWIDEGGKEIDIPTSVIDTSGMSHLGKYVSLMFANQHYLYGLFRTKVIRETRAQLSIIGSGEIFLQEMAQLGDFVLVEGERWYRRKNRKTENTIERLRRYQKILFQSFGQRIRFKFFPFMQMMLHYLFLPVCFKKTSLLVRVQMVSVSPLVLVRFLKLLLIDFVWMFIL